MGDWTVTIDRDHFPIRTVSTAAPYGAKIDAVPDNLLNRIVMAGVTYLFPADEDVPNSGLVDMAESQRAVREALYTERPLP